MNELKDGAIVLTVRDENGSEVTVFFNSYDDFFRFSKIIRTGGTYGEQYNLQDERVLSGADWA
jgi:hypothetical protein